MKNQNPTSRKREILSDPVTAFTGTENAGNLAQSVALKQLAQKAQSLKQQYKDTKSQTNIISRQIGETRRDGKPVEGLITSMQEKCARLKDIEKELSATENRILEFFETEKSSTSADETHLRSAGREPAANRAYTATGVNIENVSISLLKDEMQQWNEYVKNSPAATIHHRAEWRGLLKKTYGIDGLFFLARDANNNIAGILPLARLKSRLFGDFLVSMPWFARGGAVADHPLIEARLMQAASEHANSLGITHIEYRDDIPREGLPLQSHKVNMVLELPASVDDLWNGFSAKLRAQIKRPQRENPEVLLGGKELLGDFYRVYTRNMRDLGSPAHGKGFVGNILGCFPESSWIIVLRLGGRPVSAGLLLGHGDTLEIPLASTLREVNALSINMLLYWEVLKFAISRGFHQFDFGRSSRDTGTYRFKRQWGAQPKQLYWHYWLRRSGELPSLNPANPKYTLVINVWKRLPVAITRLLGPMLIRHLP